MRYLVPLDFSAATPPTVAAIEKLAAKEDKITLLHAAEPNPAFVGYEAGPDVVREQIANEYKREHKEIQNYAKALRKKGFDAKALLVRGKTVKTILETAAKEKADMIVMGSHGHSAAYQILVGSISEGVLHKSKIPVLFVPPKGK